MAKKTVLKNMLAKWGILSIEMQKAFAEDDDEQVIKDESTEEVTVIDSDDFEVVEDDPEQAELDLNVE